MTDDPRLVPADGDLRDRYAEALYQWTIKAAGGHRLLPPNEAVVRENAVSRADAVLAVRDAELERLRAEIDRLADYGLKIRDERDAMAAVMERMPDTHACFGVVGSDEPPKCADWCDVCRRERIEAERDAAHAAIVDALVVLTGDQIGNPVLPEVRAQIIARLESALDASSAPESPADAPTQPGAREDA